ncbi:MAG: hypothetical protein LBB66_09415 [Desulfovibrio sp.]|jgi:homocitrate synthase NifV|nr:hypothetical protein [Desulfovibrio sp.]
MLLVDVTLVRLRSAGCDISRKDAANWRVLLHGLGIDRVEDTAGSAGRANLCPVADAGARGAMFLERAADVAPEKLADRRVAPLRLFGLDDALLLKDWRDFLARLRNLGKSLPLELAFGNSLGCATALGATWLLKGGETLVCSFAGVGNLAPFEEVAMALHISGARSFTGLSCLPSVRALFGRMAHGLARALVPPTKAVAGHAVFAVESGIHVDGLRKDPALYEPFAPELVGAKRRVVPGSHSGTSAIRLCCEILGLPCDAKQASDLLLAVRNLSRKLERGLDEEEFRFLHERICREDWYAAVACD